METMWQFPDQRFEKDSLNPVSPWDVQGERRRLSQKRGGSVSRINSWSIDELGPNVVTHEEWRSTTAISGNDLGRVTSNRNIPC
jgi:hypothetical protein